MLRDAYSVESCAPNYEPDRPKQQPNENLISFARARRCANLEAFQVRDSFAENFRSDERVHWQDHAVNRTDQN